MTVNDKKMIPLFGYEIIRDHLLQSILGKHEDDVLYWAGKEIARKFPLFSMDEAATFFHEAGWGELEFEKETADSAYYILALEPESLNLENRCFKLEAGFLAEQMQKTRSCLSECYDEINKKHNFVKFTVKWDSKEKM